MAWQTVQKDGSVVRLPHKRRIHLVPIELGDPLFVLLLLTHGHPSVSHHNVGTHHGIGCVGRQVYVLGIILLGQSLSDGHDAFVWFVTGGSRNSDIHAHLGRTQHEIMQNVVPVSNPSEGLTLEVSSTKPLLKRLKVGQGLERMVKIRQCVDDGNLGILGKLKDVVVTEDSCQDNGVEPAQDLRRVSHGFVYSQLNVGRAEEERMTAQQGHASLGRDTSTGRSLLEDHGH
mmetsp:Transcript_26484/g.49228  ORF Transcript_26484/g.49228 Transcript_26484/m.49228 type:complete len:230 (+) Transcript_26484:305-994(+)